MKERIAFALLWLISLAVTGLLVERITALHFQTRASERQPVSQYSLAKKRLLYQEYYAEIPDRKREMFDVVRETFDPVKIETLSNREIARLLEVAGHALDRVAYDAPDNGYPRGILM